MLQLGPDLQAGDDEVELTYNEADLDPHQRKFGDRASAGQNGNHHEGPEASDVVWDESPTPDQRLDDEVRGDVFMGSFL